MKLIGMRDRGTELKLKWNGAQKEQMLCLPVPHLIQ